VRIAVAVIACVLALTMLPFFFSARYTDNSIRDWRTDPQGALDDLDRAADLNPWSSRPLAAESDIAAQLGERSRALESIGDAIGRSPDDWLLYLQQARVLGRENLQAARVALARARHLNPRGPEIGALAGSLGIKG
jgi:tetratricopeptide (TPR) repeat protein